MVEAMGRHNQHTEERMKARTMICWMVAAWMIGSGFDFGADTTGPGLGIVAPRSAMASDTSGGNSSGDNHSGDKSSGDNSSGDNHSGDNSSGDSHSGSNSSSSPSAKGKGLGKLKKKANVQQY